MDSIHRPCSTITETKFKKTLFKIFVAILKKRRLFGVKKY